MRRARWLLLFMAMWMVGPSLSRAQSAAATRRTLAALEDEWIRAVIKRDAAAFSRLLAADFTYTEDDRVLSREQLIEEVVASTDTVTSGRNEDMKIRLYGDAAVVTGWLVLEGRNAKGSFTARYRYTDTWVRIGPRWRVVAAQDWKKP